MSDMWNSVAGGWERNAEFDDAHLAGPTDALLIAAAISEGHAVMDVAAGPGGAGLAAAALVGASGRVVLSDDAPGMVEAAARRAAKWPQVETLLCQEESISAPDASFDAVICRHGLMFAAHPAAAVREAARVLRPGRRYAAMTWDAREANPWLGVILDAVGAQFGVPFPPPSAPTPFALDDPDLLEQTLSDGGLIDINVARFSAPMNVASLDEWWERVPQLAGPLAVALAGMPPDVTAEIAARSLKAGAVRARQSGDRVVLDGSVLVASGRTPA